MYVLVMSMLVMHGFAPAMLDAKSLLDMQTWSQPCDGANENLVMQMSFMRMQMQMYVLVMQVSFMRMQMQMQMYVFVMYVFATAWACRCKYSQIMKFFYFANVFQEDAYANVMHVMQVFEPILMAIQKLIAAFLFKK